MKDLSRHVRNHQMWKDCGKHGPITLDKPINEIIKNLGSTLFPKPAYVLEDAVYKPEPLPEKPPLWNTPVIIREMKTAIHKNKTKSAPGPNGVTGSMLRNLPIEAKQTLQMWFNNI